MSEDKNKELQNQALNTNFNSRSGLLPYGTKKILPNNFKVTRYAMLQLSKVERDLFTDMEEKQSGNYIISGISQKVSEFDLSSFTFAVAQILFNQSYIHGNEDINSGINRDESRSLTAMAGYPVYKGEINTTLNEICRLAYGVDEPSAKQRKAMESLIDTLHVTPVKIRRPDGQVKESTLCAKMDKTIRPEDGAISYLLFLHPIFTENIKNNFAELPQNIMRELAIHTERRTVTHLRLIRLLSVQRKDVPFTRHIATLIQDLGLESSYRKNAGRTEDMLLSVFKSMEDIKLLASFPQITYTKIRGKDRIEKITFILNDEFTRGKRTISKR